MNTDEMKQKLSGAVKALELCLEDLSIAEATLTYSNTKGTHMNLKPMKNK
jgi:hypothetical protein